MKSKKYSLKSVFILTVLAFSFLFSSCDAEKKSEEALTTGDGPTPFDPTLQFNVQVSKNIDPAYYKTHKLVGGINGDTDWTQNCTIDKSVFGTANADIYCIAEGHELDIWDLGAKIEVSIPPGICDYVTEQPFYFFQYRPGVGNPTPAYSTSPPGCSFDYSASGGPNCCSGKWSMTGGTPVQTVEGNYGGKFENCYAGGGLGAFTKDKNGVPMGFITYTNGSGYSQSRVLENTGNSSSSNLTVANYFRPSDHTNVITGGVTYFGSTNAPISFQYQTDTSKGLVYPTSAYYEYECLNRNRERLARVRLMIREWNENAELKQGGNPDTTGIVSPFPDDSANDHMDWKDFNDISNALFPGANM